VAAGGVGMKSRGVGRAGRGREGRGVALTDEVLRGLGLNAEEVKLNLEAAEMVIGDAAEAREDLVKFFNLVMRKEHGARAAPGEGLEGAEGEVSVAASGEPVVAAAHQRVVFRFVQEHPLCVVRMPPDTSKTYCMATTGLWYLGRDPTDRGAFVSATQGQAMKPLGMIRDYIESSGELRLVFPNLRRSVRKQDSWMMTEITVERPPGIRDPSAVAIGINGALDGSRIGWAVVDDILNSENTSTLAGLKKVYEWFDSTVLMRLDKRRGRCVVTNTPWGIDDLTYKLQSSGWPTLEMDMYGNVFIYNAPHFDTAELRPSDNNLPTSDNESDLAHRLTSHDIPNRDAMDEVPLWPERIGTADIAKLKETHLPHRFAQFFLMRVRNEEAARCQQEWVDKCTVRNTGFVDKYTGLNPVVCGVDLGVGLKRSDSSTVFFVVELDLFSGKRRVLYVDSGHWPVDKIKQRFIDIHVAYHPIFRVENNAAQQWMVDLVRGAGMAIPVRAHRTGREKADPTLGLESVFLELRNGYWELPADVRGRFPPALTRAVQGALYYAPEQHTADELMAWWFAREQARDLGVTAGVRRQAADRNRQGRFYNLMSR
jgi:hypothetical protein